MDAMRDHHERRQPRAMTSRGVRRLRDSRSALRRPCRGLRVRERPRRCRPARSLRSSSLARRRTLRALPRSSNKRVSRRASPWRCRRNLVSMSPASRLSLWKSRPVEPWIKPVVVERRSSTSCGERRAPVKIAVPGSRAADCTMVSTPTHPCHKSARSALPPSLSPDTMAERTPRRAGWCLPCTSPSPPRCARRSTWRAVPRPPSRKVSPGTSITLAPDSDAKRNESLPTSGGLAASVDAGRRVSPAIVPARLRGVVPSSPPFARRSRQWPS